MKNDRNILSNRKIIIDIIRISHNNEDIVLTVVKLYDKEGKLINRANDVGYIKIKEKINFKNGK